ncbi:MAG TPA: ATPase [Rhodospirillaceae bacterium]|nr:ATPase [Magnetovibrio sp.]HBT40535.1 ATPase [Rhodospirillaceae bacterium]|tara:strand:- start:14696 stop:17422 length:2727 start_codon:yes stop_codon:yes gene_type:complete
MDHDPLPTPKAWHALPWDAAARALGSDPETGLSDQEAADRLRRYGPNDLPRPRPPGLLTLYLRQFINPLIYLLAAAAVVSVAIGEASDALFIFAVLQVNALIGTYQEYRAQKSALALDSLIRDRATVLRGGTVHTVDGRDLVPGDVIRLESGNHVPADLRLVQADALLVDESLLTGESQAVVKDAAATVAEQTMTGDRITMLHAATVVVSGRALGIVTETGTRTALGRIAEQLAGRDAAPPPLVVRLERFTRMLGVVVVVAIALLAVAMVLEGAPAVEIFLVAVALAVAALPEGLPVAITVALSVGCHRMAEKNVIVRSLPAVEGLGACTLIASDKTGTLTCNALTVKRVVIPGLGDFQVSGEGYNDNGAVANASGAMSDADWHGLRRLAEAAALCNEAELVRRDGHWHHLGDTVDVAFLALAAKAGLSRAGLLADLPQEAAIAYEPARRYGASFHRTTEGLRVYAKGAFEVILPFCRDVDREALTAQAEALAAEGFRVLAVAAGPASAPVEDLAGTADLEFLGFVGLIDPLRPESKDAVARCRRSGIDVRMVTGDHPSTALAIARDVGIAAADEAAVTGLDLKALADDPAGFARAVAAAPVFARVDPLQKLEIVKALRAQGHFVAVTGDGVNDAPALNAADIGVAMGAGGTDVARDTADLILTDDNFASIVNGVEQGRIAYDNVRKVVYLLVSTGAAEVALFFFAFLGGLPLPLYAVQLLWLNLVTQGLQHTALAFEKAEPGLLDRSPRPPNQPVFDRVMISETIVSGLFMGAVGYLFFAWMLDQGWAEHQARNALLLLLVLFENAHVFNCRSETRSIFRVPLSANWLLVGAVVISQGAHILAMHLPGFNSVLRVEAVDLETWLLVAVIAASVTLMMELFKVVQRMVYPAPGDGGDGIRRNGSFPRK